MMLLSALFYAVGMLLFIYELVYLKNAKKVMNLIHNKDSLNDDQRSHLGCLVTITIIYLVWAILGLFTSNWPIFLVLLGIGFISKKKMPLWYVRLDAVVSILLIIFAILNHFHFHINFTEKILNLF